MSKKNTPKMHAYTDLFTYTTSNGETLSFPYLENIPMGLIEDNAGKSVQEFVSNVLVEVLQDEADIRRRMPLQEFNKMVEEWLKSSAITLGELVA
ncbi:hypothetical protein [Arcanobacterium phocae]|uniref:hypothetical protein n=1 Tax=Arcanobacterium phocae TaxID=131112 RepID=UPI001C0F05C8|nr:hypothetical protein [Arcanobacterium phocae]